MLDLVLWIATFLSALGAMNWGLKSFFDLDMVKFLAKFFGVNYLDRLFYAIIALAGLYTLIALFTFQ